MCFIRKQLWAYLIKMPDKFLVQANLQFACHEYKNL